MTKIRTRARQSLSRSFSYGAAALSLVFLPLSISLTANAEACEPPADTGPGVHRPVGADAAMFEYDCGGLWISPHFTYNPATGITSATDPVVYTYNPSTTAYDYTYWVFHTPSSNYISITESTAQPPAGATVLGSPPASGSSIGNTGTGSNNSINNDGGVTGGSSINNTGPGSNNAIDGSGNNTLNGNYNTHAIINNHLDARATSGNAVVLTNTTAGSATSGSVQDIVNIVNMLQSSSNALGGDMVTFVRDIDGDVNGDLLLDPAMLGAVQPAARNTLGNNSTTLNNSVNATMNNQIDLAANSGNATVAENTSAGDATTGNAKAMANVVNLINSAITSGRSFLGVVNINGNLNGDILLPPDFVDQLIASNVPTVDIITNTGPSSNNTINNNTGSSNTDVTNTNNLGINNNVKTTAASGAADVTGNTLAGNATSGSAKTSITAFNLTGSQVIGKNSLLVFVNVAGEWVGLIVNAPQGATAAGLAGGASIGNTGPGSNNTVTGGQSNNDTEINNTANQTINNNINVAARSGDASVNRNTKAGNARSGDASTAVNLLNVQNSSLALSDWFGILFINVFGTWHGSFGVNTSAGDPVTATGGRGGSVPADMKVFSFVPSSGQGSGSTNKTYSIAPYTGSGGTTDSGSNTVASAALAPTSGPSSPAKSASATSSPQNSFLNPILVGASIAFFFVWLAAEKLYEMAAVRGFSAPRLLSSLRHFLF